LKIQKENKEKGGKKVFKNPPIYNQKSPPPSPPFFSPPPPPFQLRSHKKLFLGEKKLLGVLHPPPSSQVTSVPVVMTMTAQGVEVFGSEGQQSLDSATELLAHRFLVTLFIDSWGIR